VNVSSALAAVALLAAVLPLSAQPLSAQTPAVLADERAEYARWLASARTSPFAVIARAPVGTGIQLGPPNSDVPLGGLAEQRVTEQAGRVILEVGGATAVRVIPRGRPVPLGAYTLLASGAPGRTLLSVYGPVRGSRPPTYFPYDSSLSLSVTLEPNESGIVRLLAVDGTEVDAAEAGSVSVVIGGKSSRLAVRRVPGDDEESDLEIYFRDATNGHGSYPAGRFVTLSRLPDGHYRLDFNRARNPFCAYSSAYACPAPWPGNGMSGPVRAGERYNEGAK
jgi:hypothetical protein